MHTFRFVNAKGEGAFVKFHWKPRLGVHSLIWDECQKVGGNRPLAEVRNNQHDGYGQSRIPQGKSGSDVVAARGVVSTTAADDSLPDDFFDVFASALARHRAWDRETDSVPA